MRTTIIEHAIDDGRRRVWFLTKGHYGLLWKHVGWLMPGRGL
jgi:hypothetical protein